MWAKQQFKQKNYIRLLLQCASKSQAWKYLYALDYVNKMRTPYLSFTEWMTI